jgi:hypothetical protein
VLKLPHSLGLIVANNMWFTKAENKVKYESGGRKTVVDCALVQRRQRAMVKDVTVVQVMHAQHKGCIFETER